VLRYANYLDGAFIDGGFINGSEYADLQAEGQAFWRVIAPFVKEVNANGATFLEGIFDLSRETSEKTHYCRAKAILGDLGVTDAEIGTLEDIRYADCDGVEVPEDATEYLATTGAIPPPPPPKSLMLTDDDSSAGRVSVLTALVVILLSVS
jgi:hypothetical protein